MSAAVSPMAIGVIAIVGMFWAQRSAGERIGGFVAGLPLVSLPCALVTGLDGGSEAAMSALIGALIGTGASAFAMMLLGRFHLHARLSVGVVAMLGVSVALCWVLSYINAVSFAIASVSNVLLLAVALWVARARASTNSAPRSHVRHIGYPMLVAALVAYTLSMATLSALGPFWAGALSSSPLLGVFALTMGVTRSGRGAIRQVTHGYVKGSVCKFGLLTTMIVAVSMTLMRA